MANGKKLRIVLAIVLIVLTLVSVTFYVADILFNGTSATENLFRMIAVSFLCLGGLCRLFYSGGRRRPLSFYESQYNEEIKNAFLDSPQNKKKLLRAIRLYNENKYVRAGKSLCSLKLQCSTSDDFYAVGLVLALTLTDMGFVNEAIHEYNSLIAMDINSTTIYGNLGSLYSSIGKYDDAVSTLRLSIQNDERNPAPYNNLANLYFRTYDFEQAKIYALKALEINHKMYQSATLLAIIFSIENDVYNANKYLHIAVSNGQNPEALKDAIEYYKSASAEKEDVYESQCEE